jgi:hypothetical protein
LIRHGRHRKQRLQQLFIAAGTCLPSRCLPKIRGYTDRPTDSPLIRHGSHRKRRVQQFFCYIIFRNFLCIHSVPQPKDIIVTSGLLAFICFCDGRGAGPPHQPPTWGTRIFCQGYLPLAFGVPTPLLQGNKFCNPRQVPLHFLRLLLLALLLSQPGLGPAMAELVLLLLHVFVASGTCLPKRCLATIKGINIQTHRLMGGIYEERR